MYHTKIIHAKCFTLRSVVHLNFGQITLALITLVSMGEFFLMSQAY